LLRHILGATLPLCSTLCSCWRRSFLSRSSVKHSLFHPRSKTAQTIFPRKKPEKRICVAKKKRTFQMLFFVPTKITLFIFPSRKDEKLGEVSAKKFLSPKNPREIDAEMECVFRTCFRGVNLCVISEQKNTKKRPFPGVPKSVIFRCFFGVSGGGPGTPNLPRIRP
jgi:hypothetical protein